MVNVGIVVTNLAGRTSDLIISKTLLSHFMYPVVRNLDRGKALYTSIVKSVVH